jgi:hypothetical protein
MLTLATSSISVHHTAVKVLTLIAAVLASACGGSDPLPCDYNEQSDTSNDGSPEISGIEVGLKTKNFCGTVNNGHFNAAGNTIDVDSFRITTSADSNVIMQLLGDPELSVVNEFSIVVRDTAPRPVILSASTLHFDLGDHSARLAKLRPGSYDVTISAIATGDLSVPLNYQFRFVEDAETRCPQRTEKANYVEASDGTDNHGNDIFDADFSKSPAFATTSSATDVAETTKIKLGTSSKVRITGSSAMVATVGQYQDRDTYEITTGDSTNEVTLALAWDGVADLDVAMVEANTAIPAGLADISASSGGERATFAVKPKTTYWVWIGAFDKSAATDYDLTLCGGQAPE